MYELIVKLVYDEMNIYRCIKKSIAVQPFFISFSPGRTLHMSTSFYFFSPGRTLHRSTSSYFFSPGRTLHKSTFYYFFSPGRTLHRSTFLYFFSPGRPLHRTGSPLLISFSPTFLPDETKLKLPYNIHL